MMTNRISDSEREDAERAERVFGSLHSNFGNDRGSVVNFSARQQNDACLAICSAFGYAIEQRWEDFSAAIVRIDL